MSDYRMSPTVGAAQHPRALRSAEGVIAQYVHDLSAQHAAAQNGRVGALAEPEQRAAVARPLELDLPERVRALTHTASRPETRPATRLHAQRSAAPCFA
jgi:hypothetical protein